MIVGVADAAGRVAANDIGGPAVEGRGGRRRTGVSSLAGVDIGNGRLGIGKGRLRIGTISVCCLRSGEFGSLLVVVGRSGEGVRRLMLWPPVVRGVALVMRSVMVSCDPPVRLVALVTMGPGVMVSGLLCVVERPLWLPIPCPVGVSPRGSLDDVVLQVQLLLLLFEDGPGLSHEDQGEDGEQKEGGQLWKKESKGRLRRGNKISWKVLKTNN